MSKLTIKDLKAQGFELSKEDATELLPKVSQASQHGISEIYAEPKGKKGKAEKEDAKTDTGADAGAGADNDADNKE